MMMFFPNINVEEQLNMWIGVMRYIFYQTGNLATGIEKK